MRKRPLIRSVVTTVEAILGGVGSEERETI